MTREFNFVLIALCLLVTSSVLIGCATVKTPDVVYFNDSDRVYPGNAFTNVCSSVNFDYVVMSKGMFRTLTDIEPGEKPFSLIYHNKQ